MSLHADRVPDENDLTAIVHRAGGERTARGDGPAHYGSAAGELATLSCGVGLTERSGLAIHALEGPAAAVEDALIGLTDQAPAPGGAVVRGDTWWCGTASGQAIVIAPAANTTLLRGRLDWHRARRPALRVRDLGADRIALGILGARAGELLASLGVYGESGDPRLATPVHVHPIAQAEVLWLLRSDRDAVAIVTRRHAARVWVTLREAGRPLRLAVVGHDAVARYALAERRRVAL